MKKRMTLTKLVGLDKQARAWRKEGNTQERMREIERKFTAVRNGTEDWWCFADEEFKFVFESLNECLKLMQAINKETDDQVAILAIHATLHKIDALAQRGEGGSE